MTKGATSHDCPAVDALFDILDIKVGYVAPAISNLSAEEKLVLIYRRAEEALNATG